MSRLLRTGLNAGDSAPMAVVGGEGVYFHLADGRKLIDGSNTGGGLGHRHPAMVEAIRRAADTPVVNEGWTWVGREQAADDLMAIAFKGEDDWVGAVRFCISGSEANDMALSLCQAMTQRSALATRERAYHGITGLSRSMTVQPQWHGGLAVHAGGSKLPAPMAPVRILPAPDGAIYGGPANSKPPSEYLADARRLLSDTAATIIDYTQGGIYYDGAYQDEVARCAREAGSYWIADEVVTGAGRAGRWFAFQGSQSRPDIVTLGKSLGGGAAAVAAVVVSKEIVERLKGTSWQNYGTLRGHPISMAAVSGLPEGCQRRQYSRACEEPREAVQPPLACDRSETPQRAARGGAGAALDGGAARTGLALLARRHYRRSDRLARRDAGAGSRRGDRNQRRAGFAVPGTATRHFRPRGGPASGCARPWPRYCRRGAPMSADHGLQAVQPIRLETIGGAALCCRRRQFVEAFTSSKRSPGNR
ncbi:4-aminobutyrate aminotransferase-like enzyme [Bradyrhizobium ottawaense]|uniref:aminotransferase class III-fold pyridoxal phosphate-dependent enzyme n=1 Tax=Bradyrhizobium ottawaense TaxID=931866 RepID=UPI0035968102